MGFPKCEESEKQLLVDSFVELPQPVNLIPAVLTCSPAVIILSEIED